MLSTIIRLRAAALRSRNQRFRDKTPFRARILSRQQGRRMKKRNAPSVQHNVGLNPQHQEHSHVSIAAFDRFVPFGSPSGDRRGAADVRDFPRERGRGSRSVPVVRGLPKEPNERAPRRSPISRSSCISGGSVVRRSTPGRERRPGSPRRPGLLPVHKSNLENRSHLVRSGQVPASAVPLAGKPVVLAGRRKLGPAVPHGSSGAQRCFCAIARRQTEPKSLSGWEA